MLNDLPKTALAFYYPWYGTYDGPSGKVLHWDEPTRSTPILGQYDSKDPSIVEQHVVHAGEVLGLDGFICGWWGKGSESEKASRVLLDVVGARNAPLAPERLPHRFSVAPYIEPVLDVDAFTGSAADAFTDALLAVHGLYRHSPAALRADGKIVVFVYGDTLKQLGFTSAEQLDAAAQGISTARSVLLGEGAAGLLVIGDAPGFDDVRRFFEVFDGGHDYIDTKRSDSATRYAHARNMLFAERAGKVFCGSLFPGFWRGADNEPERQRYGINTLVDQMRIVHELNPRIVTLTSYNEWHEDTQWEPSEEHGDVLDEPTREGLDAWRQLP